MARQRMEHHPTHTPPRQSLAPTAKAWVDGAVNGPFKGHRFGPGLLPDDDDQHLVGPDLRRGPRTHREPLIFITIMELT